MPTVPETSDAHQTDGQRDAPAEDEPAQLVSPQLVGAHEVGNRPAVFGHRHRRLVAHEQALVVRVEGSDQRREDRGDGQQDEEDAGQDRELVLEQGAAVDPQSARGRREDRFVSPRQCRRAGLDRLAHPTHP